MRRKPRHENVVTGTVHLAIGEEEEVRMECGSPNPQVEVDRLLVGMRHLKILSLKIEPPAEGKYRAVAVMKVMVPVDKNLRLLALGLLESRLALT